MAVAANPLTATADEVTSNLLALGLEVLFLGIVIIIAGISDEIGKLVSIFMFGLFMVFLVAHPQVFARFTQVIGTVGKQAQ